MERPYNALRDHIADHFCKFRRFTRVWKPLDQSVGKVLIVTIYRVGSERIFNKIEGFKLIG